MAILDNEGNLHGSEGNKVHRNVRGKNVVQAKPVHKNQTAPSIKTSIEFGLISNTARTLRIIMENIFNWHDGQMGNRLNGVICNAFKGCESLPVNKRDFHDSELSSLAGLQLNLYSPLPLFLKIRPSVLWGGDGDLTVTLPPLISRQHVISPKSVLSIKSSIQVTLILVNFREDYYQIVAQQEEDIKAKGMNTINWHFDPSIPDGCALLVFMSLQYYVEDAIQGRRNLNGEKLNPVELIGAYQFWKGRMGTESLYRREHLPGYRGNEMLRNSVPA